MSTINAERPAYTSLAMAVKVNALLPLNAALGA
jgi:hypothetical protein